MDQLTGHQPPPLPGRPGTIVLYCLLSRSLKSSIVQWICMMYTVRIQHLSILMVSAINFKLFCIYYIPPISQNIGYTRAL